METEKCNTNTIAIFDGTEMEQRLTALLHTRPKGISDKDLSNEMSDLKPLQQAQIINKLLSQGCVELFKQAGSLFYRFKDSTKLVKGSTNEEKIVYKIIEEAGNKGISIGDIRMKTNLKHASVQKILKSLEVKNFTKTVKSVTNNRKIYMLYHLEPDKSIIDSVWYQNNDIETEFIDVLCQQCYQFLKQKSEKMKSCNAGPIRARNATCASSEEMWKFISDLGISKVKLCIEDIEMILNILIYDGKIERIPSGGKNLYKSIQPLMNLPGLMRSPCGLCPVKKECHDEGTFTSLSCQYIKEWLE